ncbi:hypothetical protein BGX34_005722 [Mortierella sp. NVP85]|nr:hypothetical protein BGX34_005722 [Mortierella sp. NVP85]
MHRDKLYHDRLSFLYHNGHHIRDLRIQVPHLEIFDSSRCTSLRKLELHFMDGDDGDETDGIDPWETTMNQSAKARTNRFARIASLIQQNQGLRELWIGLPLHLGVGCLESLDQPILDAIRTHPFLTKIKFGLDMSCLLLAKLINNLPPQLQDLDIKVSLAFSPNHDLCDAESQTFNSQSSVFSIRRLIFGDGACFARRLFIHLLRRCPDVEDLRLPYAYTKGETRYDLTEVAQSLDSDFTRLSSLTMDCYCPECHPKRDMSVLLEKFSKGFKSLHLSVRGCHRHDTPPNWASTFILERLLTTPTVATIEILCFLADFRNGDHVIRILQNCPQLRVLRVGHLSFCEGMDASALLSSMKKPWKCQDTLEELQLKIRENTHDTKQDLQQLCLRLKSFPKSVILIS